MDQLKKTILSWLLHNANREGRNEHFYEIKNRILAKYGKLVCYDVQFIEGKKCHSCGGTGIYTGYYSNDDCYHCFNGWYKRKLRPQTPENILEFFIRHLAC